MQLPYIPGSWPADSQNSIGHVRGYPNHVHVIVIISDSEGETHSRLKGRGAGASAEPDAMHSGGGGSSPGNGCESIIRSRDEIERIHLYIEANSIQWVKDRENLENPQ